MIMSKHTIHNKAYIVKYRILQNTCVRYRNAIYVRISRGYTQNRNIIFYKQ